jgi:hypothetical protein
VADLSLAAKSGAGERAFVASAVAERRRPQLYRVTTKPGLIALLEIGERACRRVDLLRCRDDACAEAYVRLAIGRHARHDPVVLP